VKVKFDRKVLYELDGGDRTEVRAFKIKVEPGAVLVCVPGRDGAKDRAENAGVGEERVPVA
jgi:hypothetical protein